MDKSLLYVSKSLVDPRDRNHAVADIVTVARSRNATLRVTGALISTDGAFAQVLEGPPAAVDELMVSIYRDRRHTDVNVVLVESLAERRFPAWALAYSGLATYVRGHIEPLMGNTDDGEAKARQLIRLMEAWVRP
ncbi:MAG: blue light sensor protein [Caulobacteraceae bacterium]|nr:blue light sensor protein [Caulobacteraceae bacterium]